MDIYQFNRRGEMPQQLELIGNLPDEGFIWMDFGRREAQEWPTHVEPLAQAEIYDNHVLDSFSSDHSAFFDFTEDYELLIFQALIPPTGDRANLIETRAASFFLFDHLLVTVHADENISFDAIKRKFCESKLRFPSTPLGLAHAILDHMVDGVMHVSDELERRLQQEQDQLLDPDHPFESWAELLRYRKQAHDLETLCEHNLDAIDAWKRQIQGEISERQRTRLNDLREHILRIQAHADGVQKDIDAAVQLHFAAMSHRTTRIMSRLTVISAVFFPLTLITGIYGMNFAHMPELQSRYGYFIVLAALPVIAGLLFYLLKRGRYL